jgi:hypothetical protein
MAKVEPMGTWRALMAKYEHRQWLVVLNGLFSAQVECYGRSGPLPCYVNHAHLEGIELRQTVSIWWEGGELCLE